MGAAAARLTRRQPSVCTGRTGNPDGVKAPGRVDRVCGRRDKAAAGRTGRPRLR